VRVFGVETELDEGDCEEAEGGRLEGEVEH
jgi:hypothetical protein